MEWKLLSKRESSCSLDATESRRATQLPITNFNVTDPSVGTYPCWRYDTVDGLLQRFELGMSTPSIPLFRTLLDGVHIPGTTSYSNIFDGSALKAYLYRSGNFRDVRVIDLSGILAEGPPRYQTLEAFFGADTD